MAKDDHIALATRFRALHVPGRPLVLFNVWDAGSARVVATRGAVAIATGSWSVAQAHGAEDGEALALDLVLANLARIVAATGLPTTLDLEAGYGGSAPEVGLTCVRLIGCGAIGCNIEDGVPGETVLRRAEEQADRLAAARSAFDGSGVPAFLNARTDGFFAAAPDADADAVLHDTLRRAHAYAKAGADGLFVPGVTDERMIARLVEDSPLPVNVMVGAGTPPRARLAELGVARISHGPGPYVLAMSALGDAATRAMD